MGKYRNTNPADIIFPENMGRPKKGRYGRREHSGSGICISLQP